ncbi:DNA polymerase Y family protein [Cellulomonas aerilata]|uniref:DNA polymerase Y family protein n=1 Tax=Cellulomonas aerilata TaxID=515326 RepID=UPI0027D974AF|nr:DNA polymerase Y family protein [Cellulomonas aerilata]
MTTTPVRGTSGPHPAGHDRPVTPGRPRPTAPGRPATPGHPRPDRGSAPTRTAALWVPDWPVVAAMVAGQVEAHRPAAVHDGRRVTAVSAPARAQGVRRGMRRRQAQECCPGLELLTVDEGRDTRTFEPVAAAAETIVAGLEVARPGLLLLPAVGASRYHGSEEALAELLVSRVADATGHECQVGVADGLLAAVLAARSSRVVPAGTARTFLAPVAVDELVHAALGERAVAEVGDLVDLLHRLGLRTLGELTALPAADVEARFGQLGAWAHRLARGEDVRPPDRRRPESDVAVECELDPPAERVDAAAFAARRLAEQLQAMLLERSASCGRLRITARTEAGEELVRTWCTDAGGLGGLSAARITDRVRWQLEGWLSGGGRSGPVRDGAAAPEPSALVRLGISAEEVAPAGAEQGRLWGGASGGDLRAHRALLRVQGLLGGDGVLVATLQGGRDVRDQVHLVPWGDARATQRAADRPWPGRLPEPAPATVLVEPVAVEVLDAGGAAVRVDARLTTSGAPALVRWSGAPGAPAVPGLDATTHRLVAWAGPWPMVERWWTPEVRRRVHLQVALEGGRALLLSCTQGTWACEAVYD